MRALAPPGQLPEQGRAGVNWDHPLARGLVRAYLYGLDPGPALPLDLVAGKARGTANGTLASARRAEPYPCGYGLRWGSAATSADYVSYPAHADFTIGASQDFTMLVTLVSTMAGASSNWPQIISNDNLGGARRGFAIDLWNQFSIGLVECFTTAGAGSVAFPRTFVDGKPHLLIGGRRNCNTGGVLYASVDGSPSGTGGTTGVADVGNGANVLNMGRMPDSADALADVQNTTLGMFLFWKGRGFSDAELGTFPVELPNLLRGVVGKRGLYPQVDFNVAARRLVPVGIAFNPRTGAVLPMEWGGLLPVWRGPRALGERRQRQERGRLAINWQHRFARGLARAYVYGMEGLPVDLVAGRLRATAIGALADHNAGRRGDPWPGGPGLRWGASTGIADSVSYAADPDLDIGPSTSFTVLVAFLSTYVPSAGRYGMLVDCQSGGSPRGYQIGLSNNGGHGYMNVMSDSWSHTLNFTRTLVDGKPHLIIGGRRDSSTGAGNMPYASLDGAAPVLGDDRNWSYIRNGSNATHHGTAIASPTDALHAIQNTTIACLLFWKGRGFTDKELADFTPQALAELLSGGVLDAMPVALSLPPVEYFPIVRPVPLPLDVQQQVQTAPQALPISWLGMLPWLRGLRVSGVRQRPMGGGSALEVDSGHDLARGLALGFVYERIRAAQAGLAAPIARDVVGRYHSASGGRHLMAFFDGSGNGNTLGTRPMEDAGPLAVEGATWGPSTTIENFAAVTDYNPLPWYFDTGEDFTIALLVRSTDAAAAGRNPALLRSKHDVGGGGGLRGWQVLLHNTDAEPRWGLHLCEAAGGATGAVFGASDVADGRTHLLVCGRRHGWQVFASEDGRPANVATFPGPLTTVQPLQHGRGETNSFTTFRLASVQIAYALIWKGRGFTDDDCLALWAQPWRWAHVHEERHGIFIAPTIQVGQRRPALPLEYLSAPAGARLLPLDTAEAPGVQRLPLDTGEAPGVQRLPMAWAGGVRGARLLPYEAKGRDPFALGFTWNEVQHFEAALSFTWYEYAGSPLVGGALTFTWLERETLDAFALGFTWHELPAALPGLYESDITFPHGEGRTT